MLTANTVPNAKKSRPSKYRANRPTIKIKIILRINRTILIGVRIYSILKRRKKKEERRKRKKMSNYEYGPNDTDDGYDALKDNYLTGAGPAYNDKTRQAERDEEENYRQARYYY